MPPSTSSQSALSLFSLSPDPSYAVCAEPVDTAARQFLACWREHAMKAEIVIGEDIPSRPFARFLANLMIVEPVKDGKDCHIRLAGSLVRRRYGREVSGQRMSELFSPQIFERHIADMREVRSVTYVMRTGGDRGAVAPVRVQSKGRQRSLRGWQP